MVARNFDLVDVFHDGPFSGNPLAVVASAEGIDTATMQAMTRWFNLSETTFLLAPTDPRADYHVRIFTLDRELPFAGHPTLGSAHAWLAAGGAPKAGDTIVQQCGAGLIEIRRDGDRLAFAAPPLVRQGPVDDAMRDTVARLLRIAPDAIVDAAWCDNGPGWIGVLLASADAVLAIDPARAHDSRIEIGVAGPHAPGRVADWEVRTIFSDAQGALVEDPVTGSFNAALAQWLAASGRVSGGFVARQGTALGRRGTVFVDYDASGQAWIGGRSASLARGALG